MIKYRPEIDGLRTVAVLPVILFHLGFDWVSGGYLGVDVFFVISGFLITSIILKNLKSKTFSFKDFWLRRVKRIMPALLFLTISVLLIAPFLIFKGDIVFLTKDGLSAIFSYANFNAWFNFGDYWGNRAESSFFLHCWSLSLEEQFYIFYPLILFMAYKNNFSLSKIIFAIFILSFLLFVFGVLKFPSPTFYMLPTRAWQLSSGGLLAVIGFSKFEVENAKLNSVLVGFGLILIFVSYFIKGNGAINFYATLPTIGACLIIRYSSYKEFFGKILGNSIIVLIGKMSYSLYLWHWVIIVLLKEYYNHIFSKNMFVFLAIILTSIFASISYYLVEKKTRNNKNTLKLVGAFLLLNIGMITFINSELISKDYISTFNNVTFFGLKYDITPHISKPSEGNLAKRKGIIAPFREKIHENAYKNGGIITGANNLKYPEILVLGDSHGAMWAKIINEISDELNSKASFYTSVGTPPFFSLNLNKIEAVKGFSKGQRKKYAEQLINNIKLWKPKLVIVSCRWENMSEVNWRYFSKFISIIDDDITNIMVLNQPPVIKIMGDRNSSQYFSFLNLKPNGERQYLDLEGNEKINIKNKKLKELSDAYENVYYQDVYSSFYENNQILVIDDKDIFYYDDDHLSYQGTKLIKEKIKNTINKLLTESVE